MAATNNGLDEDVLQWVKKDNRRFLRANIRVGDLDRTLKFYTEFFGMKVLSSQDLQEEKYSTAVVAYGPQEDHFMNTTVYVAYLTDDPEEKLDIGTSFNHFGLATQDIYGTVEKIRAAGGTITREPGPIAEGGKTIFAFVNDPDGYSFELILRPPTPEPLCQICLNVTDIDRSIEYYQKTLGMNLLLPKYDAPQFQYTIAMVGYGYDFTQTTIIELKYNYNVKEYTKGNGYAMLAIGSDDVYKSGEAVEMVNKEFGGKTIRRPALNPKTNTKITCFLDSDGFETVLVDNQDYADFNRKIQG